ncbi:hypothetical protein ACLMJT_09990, partial [Bifidobacterium longum]
MNGIFKQLLNVKGTVVEDVRITDSPLRSGPVLEIRVRPRGACSDAPAAAGSAAVTTVAAAVVVSVIRISAAGGRTGRRHACVLASWRPLCERCFSAV